MGTGSPAQAQDASTFTFPANGAVGINSYQPFVWSFIPDAEQYYLAIGTSPGAADLYESGLLSPATTHLTPPQQLPAGPTLWARIWTRRFGAWAYSDSSFTLSHIAAASLTFPANGATNIDPFRRFAWAATAGAEEYDLR